MIDRGSYAHVCRTERNGTEWNELLERRVEEEEGENAGRQATGNRTVLEETRVFLGAVGGK